MQSCYTVHRETTRDRHVCHLDLTIIDDSHLRNLFLVSRVFLLDFKEEAAVDLLYNLVDTRKQSGEQLDRPFFKGLSHDGMVGVSAGLCCDIPCLFPG